MWKLSATFNLSNDQYWETPDHIFELGCDNFDFSPEIDVCANAQNTKCDLFLSESQNALDQEWQRDFWMNPPYGRQVKDWIRKAYLSHVKYNVSGLALLFAKTDTAAFHDYIFKKAEICFLRGRIHFFKDGKESIQPAPYPSCFVFWRAKDFG